MAGSPSPGYSSIAAPPQRVQEDLDWPRSNYGEDGGFGLWTGNGRLVSEPRSIAVKRDGSSDIGDHEAWKGAAPLATAGNISPNQSDLLDWGGVRPFRAATTGSRAGGDNLLAVSVAVQAQFRQRGGFPRGFGVRVAKPEDFGGVSVCRVAFAADYRGDGGNWSVDYPRADINLSIRLGELTKADVSMTRSANRIRCSSGSPTM